jgi:hypothetical protein
MSSLFPSGRMAISRLSRLVANFGRRCWVYISNQPGSVEWMAFAVAEAEDEWRTRSARGRRNLR